MKNKKVAKENIVIRAVKVLTSLNLHKKICLQFRDEFSKTTLE